MKSNIEAKLDHYKERFVHERMFKEAYEERNKVLESHNFLLSVGLVLTVAALVGVLLFG